MHSASEAREVVETEDTRKRALWAVAIKSHIARSKPSHLSVDERRAQVAKTGDALLKNELTETHNMDVGSYEAVHDLCRAWLAYNRFTDHRNNPVKLQDLIAAWVYSMGPGGEFPNYCR